MLRSAGPERRSDEATDGLPRRLGSWAESSSTESVWILSRSPLHVGQVFSRMYCPSHSRMKLDSVFSYQPRRLAPTPSNFAPCSSTSPGLVPSIRIFTAQPGRLDTGAVGLTPKSAQNCLILRR